MYVCLLIVGILGSYFDKKDSTSFLNVLIIVLMNVRNASNGDVCDVKWGECNGLNTEVLK